MIQRRQYALRWRIATLCSLAVALLSIAAASIAYWVVRQSLHEDLLRGLREDARRIAQNYSQAALPTPSQDASDDEITLGGPTGGRIVQLYDRQGRLSLASDTTFQNSPIDQDEIVQAFEGGRTWRGFLSGRMVRAVLAPVENFGVVAVISPTMYITRALRTIARALAATAAVLIALSAMIGYLVAAAAMRPVSDLARLAATLDPNHLEPIDYRGPNDEVGRLSHVLNDLIARLRTSMDAQRSFLAETSHELRTPLTSLQGFLDRAARRATPEVQSELEDARRIAQTMSRLVADILQLSRGTLVREYIPHLLDPYLDILRPIAEEYPGMRVEGHPGGLLLGDPERLRQLIRNLAANAVRATGNAGAVLLRLSETETHTVLEVDDSGPGIAADILPHIFDKFYKGAGGGAGLGLAIAKQIAEVHNGTLTVESHPGQGTCFRLCLPAFAEELGEESFLTQERPLYN